MKNNKLHPKYPYQRVEQRLEQHKNNNIDSKSLKEQKNMEQMSAMKISIGTFNILPPKPNTEIQSFTLAFTKSIPKDELYQKLHQTFDGYWDGEPVKSVYIHLTKPMPLIDLRKILNKNFLELFQTKNLKTDDNNTL